MSVEQIVQLSGALFGWVYIVYLVIFEGIFGSYASREIKRSIERQTERLDKLIENVSRGTGRTR